MKLNQSLFTNTYPEGSFLENVSNVTGFFRVVLRLFQYDARFWDNVSCRHSILPSQPPPFAIVCYCVLQVMSCNLCTNTVLYTQCLAVNV